MSKTSYVWNPNATRTVHYTYWDREWKTGTHVCYEKTDDAAIASCYQRVVVTYMPEFHITKIVTEIN